MITVSFDGELDWLSLNEVGEQKFSYFPELKPNMGSSCMYAFSFSASSFKTLLSLVLASPNNISSQSPISLCLCLCSCLLLWSNSTFNLL